MHELARRRVEAEDTAVDELARLAARGDEAAFDALVRRCYRRVYRWALVRVGEPDEAEDVTQEVLLRLYRHLPSWEGRGRFTTWLFGVTRNAAASQATRNKRRVRMGDSIDGPRTVAGAEEQVLGRLHATGMVEGLEGFLHELPARQRELFDLIDIQGFTPAEVARMLDMNASTVRVHLFKARRRIRAWMLRRDPDLRRRFDG